jgi:hypothetical protein
MLDVEQHSLQRRRVVKPLEVARRQEYKEDGGNYCMHDECRLLRKERPPNAHCCKADRPPYQGIDNNR